MLIFLQIFHIFLKLGETCDCNGCKEIHNGEYAGVWNLIAITTERCSDGCLYKNNDNGQEICFCDPGDITYISCAIPPLSTFPTYSPIYSPRPPITAKKPITTKPCSKYKDCVTCSASVYCHWEKDWWDDDECEDGSEEEVLCDPCDVCDQWYKDDMKELADEKAKGKENWLEEENRMFPCPCTISLKHKKIQIPKNWTTDPSCPLVKSASSTIVELFNGDGCKKFHPGALGCIRSEGKTAKGAGQQCCYDSALNLIGPDGATGAGAGTPDRAWSAGITGLLGNHKELDMYTYSWCCTQCKKDKKVDPARCKKYYQGVRKLDVKHCP
eukprot:GFUD01058659.1.p1 GENE.GFUD01058659.1~~GFUD01058659.1.p1  ORF type:complete len:335 (+),score=69.30 GFUD01058659.1:26-1006(+)